MKPDALAVRKTPVAESLPRGRRRVAICRLQKIHHVSYPAKLERDKLELRDVLTPEEDQEEEALLR